jgi:alpha-glucuronidase
MKSGRTLWDEICYHYDKGVQQVRGFQKIWDKAELYVDSVRFTAIQQKLRSQCSNAVLWKDACLLYFQQFSRMPIPYDIERPVNNLSDIIANDMRPRR